MGKPIIIVACALFILSSSSCAEDTSPGRAALPTKEEDCRSLKQLNNEMMAATELLREHLATRPEKGDAERWSQEREARKAVVMEKMANLEKASKVLQAKRGTGNVCPDLGTSGQPVLPASPGNE